MKLYFEKPGAYYIVAFAITLAIAASTFLFGCHRRHHGKPFPPESFPPPAVFFWAEAGSGCTGAIADVTAMVTDGRESTGIESPLWNTSTTSGGIWVGAQEPIVKVHVHADGIPGCAPRVFYQSAGYQWTAGLNVTDSSNGLGDDGTIAFDLDPATPPAAQDLVIGCSVGAPVRFWVWLQPGCGDDGSGRGFLSEVRVETSP